MNRLFAVVFVLSCAALLRRDPAAFLPALLRGAEDALKLGAAFAAVYAVWLGILKVAENARLTDALAGGLRPLTSRLFRVRDGETLGHIAVNLSANFFGMGGAATPAGVSAMRRLEGEKGGYARAMLFAVNSAGVQLVPVTLLALREKFGAASPYDILPPVFAASLVSLAAGMLLVRLIYGRKGG